MLITMKAREDKNMEIVRLTDEKTKVRLYEARFEDGRVLRGPSVSEATSCVNRRELIDWFKRTDLTEQKEVGGGAAETGTAIHAVLERVGKTGDVGQVPDEIKPAIQQFQTFKEKVNLQTESSEKFIFSEAYRYGGTYDQVGFIDGQRHLIDIKTGRYSEKDLWKTEAYRMAYIEMGGDKEIGMTVLYLDKEGKKPPKPYTVKHHDYCFKKFLACLSAWKGLYLQDLKKVGWDWEWLLEDPVEKFVLSRKA
jgi:hypothetical protein